MGARGGARGAAGGGAAWDGVCAGACGQCRRPLPGVERLPAEPRAGRASEVGNGGKALSILAALRASEELERVAGGRLCRKGVSVGEGAPASCGSA